MPDRRACLPAKEDLLHGQPAPPVELDERGHIKVDEQLRTNVQSIFAIGVDEMSWDDLDEKNYDWPAVADGHVRRYVADRHRTGVSPRTLSRELSALRTLFEYLLRERQEETEAPGRPAFCSVAKGDAVKKARVRPDGTW